MTKPSKNLWMTILVLVCSVNIAFSCENLKEEKKDRMTFHLENANLSQMRLLSDHELIGINGDGHVVVLSNGQSTNNIANYLNQKGKVIALHHADNKELTALLIPHSVSNALQLIKISSKDNVDPVTIDIALAPSLLCFDGNNIKTQEKNVNLIFNIANLDAQIIPFENNYTAIVFRKSIIPTVIWISPDQAPIEQLLLPMPLNDDDAQVQISVANFKAWKKDDYLMITLTNDPLFFPSLKAYYGLKEINSSQDSHIIFKSSPSTLAFERYKNFGEGANLTDSNNGNIFSVLFQEHSLAIRTNSTNQEFNIELPTDFTDKTSIRNFIFDQHDLWIVGETGINQAPTGSILAGSQGFVAKIPLADSPMHIKKWDHFKERRNCVTNIFESNGHKYLVVIENAPLTHQKDMGSTLSLLDVDNLNF